MGFAFIVQFLPQGDELGVPCNKFSQVFVNQTLVKTRAKVGETHTGDSCDLRTSKTPCQTLLRLKRVLERFLRSA
jgi:hypothetical protein